MLNNDLLCVLCNCKVVDLFRKIVLGTLAVNANGQCTRNFRISVLFTRGMKTRGSVPIFYMTMGLLEESGFGASITRNKFLIWITFFSLYLSHNSIRPVTMTPRHHLFTSPHRHQVSASQWHHSTSRHVTSRHFTSRHRAAATDDGADDGSARAVIYRSMAPCVRGGGGGAERVRTA